MPFKSTEIFVGDAVEVTNIMQKDTILSVIVALLFIGGAGYFSFAKKGAALFGGGGAYADKFDTLSKNGNSSCSGAFSDSIDGMPDTERIQGSCCSPMDKHRYVEQVGGLKKYLEKYKNISEIPPDPYDIDAGLAKKLKGYYDAELTPEQQKAYDFAMEHSMEKGPCCCKCWRWYVYGGLGKLLIQKYNFTGEQIVEVWNLSDGCGGADDHAGH